MELYGYLSPRLGKCYRRIIVFLCFAGMTTGNIKCLRLFGCSFIVIQQTINKIK